MEVPDLLRNATLRFPDRACIVEGSLTWTFADVDDRANRFAGAIASLGLQAGDRVAVLSSNDGEFTEVRLGAQRGTQILVPLNYRMSEAELRSVIADCRPRLLIVGRDFTSVGQGLPVENIWHLGDAPAPLRRYEDAISVGAVSGSSPTQPADLPAVIAYTSGTTGTPKGAVLTNGALHAGMTSLCQEMEAQPQHIYLGVMPMFHISAQVGWAFTYRGATTVQLRSFDSGQVLGAIERQGVTHTQMVPSMLLRVMDDPSRGDRDLTTLEQILYGASAMPPALLERLAREMPCRLINGYGMTEALALSALRPADHRPDDRPELLASVGTDMLGQAVRVIDEHGHDTAPGDLGEIMCRGPSVMSHYWEKPDETAAAFSHGWLRTRDIGYRSAEGYLFLTDRKDDMIISGGENVYPGEVENALFSHPSVQEAAVIGLPDAEWGQRVHAVVVTREAVAMDELITHCRERIAGYKVPRLIEFVDELPKTTTGKVLRRTLREDRKSTK